VNSPGESFSSSRALRQRVGEWIVEKDLLLKRLLMQAGVSVLAGLLMSTAVLAQDVTADAGDTLGASIGIDVGDPGDGDPGDGDQGDGDLGDGDLGGGGPDVCIDPNDPGLGGSDIGTDGGTVADGDTGGDGGRVADGEGETGEGSDPDVSIQFGTEIDAPVEATFDLTDPPEPIVDMEPVMDLAIDLGPLAQSGSGDTGQKSQENDRDYGDRGEANSHLLRQVK
jgi:hypothetical protein